MKTFRDYINLIESNEQDVSEGALPWDGKAVVVSDANGNMLDTLDINTVGQKYGLNPNDIRNQLKIQSYTTLKGPKGSFIVNHPMAPTALDRITGPSEAEGDLELEEQFDIIESMIEYWAEQYNVDTDVIWENLESVDDEELLIEAEAWQTSKGKNKNGGLNAKGVKSYRKSHPGSKLQTAVTTKPSKLKKGSKAANRRKSFCARMKGMKKHRTGSKTAHDPNSRINKSLRKWNCESVEQLYDILQTLKETVNPTQQAHENFADGKHPGRKGLAKRSGVNTKASVSSLRKTARHSTGEKARMAHWLANMKAGRANKQGVAEAFDKPHKTKLNELFTSYGGYELHHNPRNADRGYIYSFDTKDKRDGEIIIKPKHLKQGVDSIVFVEFNIDGSTDTSGKGDAIMIFSTVLKAVNGFAREYKPQYIVFETEDPEKLKLYRRLVKYFVGYKPVDWTKDTVLNRQIGPELSGFAEEAIVLQRQDNADSIKTQSPSQGLYVIYGRGKYAGQVWHRFDLDSTVTPVGRYTREDQAEKFADEWVEKNGKRLGNQNMNYPYDWYLAKDPSGLEFGPAPAGQYSQVSQQDIEYIAWYLSQQQNLDKQGVAENFADGRNPGRKGLAKRSGVNTKASVSSLRKTAQHSTGEKARMAHWLANMKAGKAKKK
jgi:hypothetical protein